MLRFGFNCRANWKRKDTLIANLKLLDGFRNNSLELHIKLADLWSIEVNFIQREFYNLNFQGYTLYIFAARLMSRVHFFSRRCEIYTTLSQLTKEITYFSVKKIKIFPRYCDTRNTEGWGAAAWKLAGYFIASCDRINLCPTISSPSELYYARDSLAKGTKKKKEPRYLSLLNIMRALIRSLHLSHPGLHVALAYNVSH